MPRRTGPTNPALRRLINYLEKSSRENKAPVWRAVAEKLRKPTRMRAEVNVGKINKLYREDRILVVPGKVLAGGNLDKPVVVAAFKFSRQAIEKIKKAGGKALSIEQVVVENPKGRNVVIVT